MSGLCSSLGVSPTGSLAFPDGDRMSEELSAFIEVARRYCSFVEHPPDTNGALVAAQLLSRLYAAGLAIGEVEPGEIDLEQFRPTLVPPSPGIAAQYYSMVIDPFAIEQPETAIGDLCDDILDVYIDVKTCLAAYDAGYGREAEWFWWFHCRTHWGHHASDAIRALHKLIAVGTSSFLP